MESLSRGCGDERKEPQRLPPSAEARIRQKQLLPLRIWNVNHLPGSQSNSIAIIHNVVEIMDFPQSGMQKVRLCVLLVQKSGQPLLAGD